MKISVICCSIFLCCIIHWACDSALGLVLAEDDIPFIDESDNNTTNSRDHETEFGEPLIVPKSVGNLETNEIKSSVTDVLNEDKDNFVQSPEHAFIETVSQNVGIPHEIASTGSDVHSGIDSATLDLQLIASPPLAKRESSNFTENNSSVLESINSDDIVKTINVKVEDVIVNNATTQTDQVPSVEPKNNETEKDTREDIPSFSEWTQKQLEEAEKKKEQANSSVNSQHTNGKPSSSLKKRWKNYASPDCGAKIIAANPEAISAGSVLSSSRDEYKLNACTTRIWFIVELCEAIQVKRIHVANFELFSSSPKDFSIFVGDRFPTRDWLSVGHFTAKDERDIQSFDLSPQLFGKYIKFEMHSHHGSEHYCPISLFRVFGTSEFEVLETENEVHSIVTEDDDDDDDEDGALDSETGEAPRNLFSSATDAVISMVKKAAQVLGNKGNASASIKEPQNSTVVMYTPLINTCTTPSYLVVCDNCSDLLYGTVFELLSCHSRQLMELLSKPIIKNALYKTEVCSKFGLEFRRKSTTTVTNYHKSYINSFLSQKYVAALCNTLAIDECKVVRNTSHFNATNTVLSASFGNKVTATKVVPIVSMTIPIETILLTDELLPVTNPLGNDVSAPRIELNDTDISYASQIKPTKTLSPSDDLNVTEAPINIETIEYEKTATFGDAPLENNATNENEFSETENNKIIPELVDMELPTESSESLDDHLDALVTEFNGDGLLNVATTTVTPPAVPQGQKESVFLRLSNRIKALERNMSLSSQYLEELSRRYKKQVEEMQRLLDKTINTFNEESKKKDDKTQLLEEQIILLRELVENIIEDKNSWLYITYYVVITGSVLLGTLLFCCRNLDNKQPFHTKTQNSEIQRRNSVDVISHETPVKKHRRPSEEAMKAGGSTCSELLIEEDSSFSSSRSRDKKRKRKKNGNHGPLSKTSENSEGDDDNILKTGFLFPPKITSSIIMGKNENNLGNLQSDWVGEMAKHDRILENLVVLEESEHTSLEPLPPLLEHSSKTVNGNPNNFLNPEADLKPKTNFFQRTRNGSLRRKGNHKKSASLDDAKTLQLPNVIETNLSNSYDSTGDAPKKEKKSTFRRFIKSLTSK